MKSKFVKLFMLPVAAFFLASAAAVSSSDVNKSESSTVAITGYIHSTLPASCDPVSVECETSGNTLCMYGNYPVFDRDSPNSCITALWKTE